MLFGEALPPPMYSYVECSMYIPEMGILVNILLAMLSDIGDVG